MALALGIALAVLLRIALLIKLRRDVAALNAGSHRPRSACELTSHIRLNVEA